MSKKSIAPDRLQAVVAKMLGLGRPAKISALLCSTLHVETGVQKLGVFLKGECVAGDEDLLPEDAVLEFIREEGKWATVPHTTEGLITVFPLQVQGRQIGFVVLDVTPVAEEMASTDLAPLEAFLNQAAALLHSSLVIEKNEEQKSLLGNILDSINSGIVTLDRGNLITRINRNAMAMMELSPDDVGRPYAEVLGVDVSEAVDGITEELKANGFAMERMIRREFSNGLKLHMAVTVSLLRDDELNPLGMTLIFRDMTASRELERLRKLDTMKTEFVSNVSHELKTPLTSIKAYTEALQGMTEDEMQLNFLKVVEEESDRLLFLINDLLNVSRIQSGKMKMHLELCDPRVIVNDVLSISKVQSDKHELVPELAEGLSEILIDKEKMKEVTINLISNAIKYSPNGGKVYVRMFEKEGNLVLEVEDEGLGIAKGSLAKVFDSFYRVDSSLTAEIGGTGLGLAITKAIVENHGGKVWVDSEEGKGSTFSLMIPIRKQKARGEDMEAMA